MKYRVFLHTLNSIDPIEVIKTDASFEEIADELTASYENWDYADVRDECWNSIKLITKNGQIERSLAGDVLQNQAGEYDGFLSNNFKKAFPNTTPGKLRKELNLPPLRTKSANIELTRLVAPKIQAMNLLGIDSE